MGDVVVAKILPSILDAQGSASFVRTDEKYRRIYMRSDGSTHLDTKPSVDVNVSLNLSQALIQGSELCVSNKEKYMHIQVVNYNFV